MADAYSIAAAAIKAVIDLEFQPEGFAAGHDKLHESLGTDGTAIGISPVRWLPNARNRNEQWTFIFVQFYDVWTKAIDPTQAVDPRRITTFADRFQAAVESQQATDTGSGDVWWFDVEEVNFPDDPTGNKTRFEATLRARGNNHALLGG